MKRTLALLVAFACIGSLGYPAETAKTNFALRGLQTVPAPELPARAAAIVKAAKAGQRDSTTIEVTKAAVTFNPAASPAIVGAIIKSVPQVAPVCAGTAAAEQPAQAAAITKAAVAAAPSLVGEIVVAVCRAVPNQYRTVALAASQAAPDSSRQILKSVAQALPDLKPGIDRVLSASSTPMVLATLENVQPASQSGSSVTPPVFPGARGPLVGPPYQPLSGTPTNVNPANSGDQPTGGRNYAAP